MLATSVNSISSSSNSKANKNKAIEEKTKNNNENDMIVDVPNNPKDKDNDVSMKDNNNNNTSDSRSNRKNKDYYNRNNSSRGYRGNYRNNQNKLNHKNSNGTMMSDYSSSNNGRYYNSSRGGNKKSRPNYSNSGNNNNNNNNHNHNSKAPVKDIKEIQKKLDNKIAKENANTFIAPSSNPITSTNDDRHLDNDNTIETQLTLDNVDPKILERKDNLPISSPPPPTEDIKEIATEIENEDTPMTEPDFLNGFSSDKIENAGKIFIGGLTYETTDEKLREHFEQYGRITECTVMKDNNGCSRGFGFITYENPEVLDKVLEINHILDGKTIDPKRAIPRDRQDKTEKIFVGGIHPDVTEAEFKAAFDSFGKVIDATLITAKDTGKSRCFGFITYEDGRGVEVAYANRHNIVLNGKKVEVKYAAPKPKLSGSSMNPMMMNMNGMNNMNMRLPVGIPMGMGVINIPPQPPQPHMPPPKMAKGGSSSSNSQYSPNNKQGQKYYQQNVRSGQVGPIRNQHNHAYPQDFQYSRYMNMNMYTTYNYPYNNPPAGYMGYDYDNYNMTPMAGYGNPPYPNSTAAYPSSYMNRNMGGYPQGHPYGSNSGSSNSSSSNGHSSYNNHGNNNRNSGGSSSNYYRNSNHGSPTSNPPPNASLPGSSASPNYNGFNGYGMSVYSNNYIPFNGPPTVVRMNSNSSSSSSNGHGHGHGHGSGNHNNNNNMNTNDTKNNDDDMNNTTIYMGANPRNNHGYHP